MVLCFHLLLDCYDLCDSAWCVKKRGKENVIDNKISNFDDGLVVKDRRTGDNTDQNQKENFDQNTKGYCRCKTVDKSLYKTLKTEYQKHVTCNR